MSSFESPNRPSERNLLFAGLALEMGWIQAQQINHAFTIWACDKSQLLGDILVDMRVLTEEQKRDLDRLVDAKVSAELPAGKALASIDSLDELSIELSFLNDSDLNEPLQQAKKEHPPQSSPLGKPSGQNDSEAISATEGSSTATEPLRQRFEPVCYLNSQGGMGEVWIARDKELNRYVVVKYIHRFRAKDPHHRGLFQLEGEVTGHLEHPNIPPVYSLGVDPASRDYFAMRYFKGRRLTEAIGEYHGLPRAKSGVRREKLVELLQAFQTACLTVEFAHHRGVIHCDLKPDNIMVGPYGETLVIDWGLVIVKEAGQDRAAESEPGVSWEENPGPFAPSKTASSGLHEKQGGSRKTVGGTLAYMSPEQLSASENMEIAQITSASDVFGLGATLYHLLTNRPPYLPKTGQKETKVDFYDRIRRADFPRPRTLSANIAKPLESIVCKAMRADPRERYPSPRELADDIRRWLSDGPTLAHPEGMAGKAGRWLRRNRKLVLVAVALLLTSLLTGGFLVVREQQRTQEFASQLKAVADNGFKIVEELEPLIANEESLTPERRKILIDSASAYESIIANYPSTLKTKTMAARIFRYTANIYRTDFDTEKAEPFYAKAIEIYRTGLKGQEELDSLSLSLSQTLMDYGQLLASVGQMDQAIKVTEEAREMVDARFGSDSARPTVMRVRCLAHLCMAGIRQYLGDVKACESESRSAIGLLEELQRAKQFRGYDFIFLTGGLTYLGTTLREQNKLEESHVALQKGRATLAPYIMELKEYDQTVVREVAKIDVLRVFSDCRTEGLLTLMRLNREPDDMEQALDSIVGQVELVIRKFPDNARFKFWLSGALATRGAYFKKVKKNDRSQTDFDRAKKVIIEAVGDHPNRKFHGDYYLRLVSDFSNK